MSNSVLIIGASGSGKSTSIRTLDESSTFIINVLGKPLPFRGYKNKYKAMSSWDDAEGNYYASDDWTRIIKCIQVVDKNRPDIKVLVIDDLQYVLAGEFMRRVSEKGYDKYSELGNHFWQIINAVTTTRDDLVCVLLSHSETDQMGRSKLKTIGKLLDEKVTIEGMFTTILHSMVMDDGYKFLTQSDGTHIAKSPMGMFEDKYIDNDLKFVCESIQQYFNEEE